MSESPPAEAESADRKRAEQLYREGVELLGAGNYSEAEARFATSYQLLQGRGTLLNLAICHEDLGKFASAWREFNLVYEEALRAGDTPREEAAREHLTWLAPQLSYLNVVLSDAAKRAQVRIELDGTALSSTRGLIPVDPGEHQLRVSAPGKQPWATQVSIEAHAPPKSVLVPALADELAVTSKPEPEVPHARAPLTPPVVPRPDFSGAYIAGSATITLGVGAVLSSFLYYDRRSSYFDSVTEQLNPDEQRSRHDSAQRMAWINGSLIVGASAGALITGILWYRARDKASPHTASAWVAPLLLGSSSGLQAGLRF